MASGKGYDQVLSAIGRCHPVFQTRRQRINSGNGIHEEMDQRAIACFDQALADTGLDANDALRRALHAYFAWATTTTMAQYHESADDVPEGLTIARWSWDGLQ